MEAPKDTFRSVHVLRHSFVPSESLTEHLEGFVVKNEPLSHPPFKLYSSFEVAVHSDDTYRVDFEREYAAINEAFRSKSGWIALKSVAYAHTPTKGLAFLFTVNNPERLRTILSPLDTLPHVFDMSDRTGSAVLKTAIPPRYLADKPQLSNAWSKLRTSLKSVDLSPLLYVAPDKIAAKTIKVPNVGALDQESVE
jgi:hypothetical protein